MRLWKFLFRTAQQKQKQKQPEPLLRRYWFPATAGFGIGVTAPDAGTAHFSAMRAIDRLPAGARLTGEVVADVDLDRLDSEHVRSRMASPDVAGVWFPKGHSRPVYLQAAATPAEALERFVYVRHDGSAREITDREAKYLATAFEAADGGRPYIKKHYDSRTYVGGVRGFLLRAELPQHIRVKGGAPPGS